MIIFDILNIQKTARDMFRQRLGAMGFYPLQKSVFVCPYPCHKEIKLIRDFFEINEKHIHVIVAEIDGALGEELRRKFKLAIG